MKPEIEAKFLGVSHRDLRDKLKAAGATCTQSDRLMRRKNYDFADMRLARSHNAWVRVRDEGSRITLSYKQLDDRSLHGTQEICLTVDDFTQADALLRALGLEAKTYQETKRESWLLDGVEIELDEWPWAKPYAEIEGNSGAAVKETARRLGLDWSAAVHGSVEVVYQAEYDATDEEIDTIPVITFEEPMPAWLAERRKTSA